jgi:bifunctional DNA-binding transcriptional regulator/antitoxin component of YhaV-PrlF toxin-antitoxin module
LSVLANLNCKTYPPSMNALTKVTAKGTASIPKDVLAEMHWPPGTELRIEKRAGGLLVKSDRWDNPFPRTTIEDFLAHPPLKWHGPPRSVEEISGLDDETLRQIFDERDQDEGSRY